MLSPGNQLLAYLQLTTETMDDLLQHNRLTDYVKSLRQKLQQQLPEHMVPTLFIPLTTWPLTTNGKIDKNALPGVEQALVIEHWEAPQSDIEHQLVNIWAALLNQPIDHISVVSSFFDVGGHSLLAVQLANRIGEQFAIEIPLDLLFEHRDIRTQAQLIQDRISLREIRHHVAFDESETEVDKVIEI